MAQVACVMKEVTYFVEGVKDQASYWTTEEYKQVNDYAMTAYLVIYQKNLQSRTATRVSYETLRAAINAAPAPEKSTGRAGDGVASNDPATLRNAFMKRVDDCHKI